jgi:type IX secretion system PorP/SprF family membrane protein
MNNLLKIILLLMLSIQVYAQDPQFSQYYNAPLYLNPAFAGTGANTRLVFNFRSQWPGISSTTPYVTTAFSFDHNIESINSGVGLMVTRDRQGTGKLTSTDVSLFYSYQVNISKKWTFRPGLQATLVSRNVNYAGLVFSDQLSDNGPNGNPSNDKIAGESASRLYPDISGGALIYSDIFWLGLSAHHLNKPDQSFGGNKFSLPIKTSLQAGMRIPFGKQSIKKGYSTIDVERSILPSVNFKSQGKFNQLDLGIYMIYEPMMFGVWYRGIPLKIFEGIPSNESVIFMGGIHYHKFSFGYSYDLTVSQLALRNSNGAHEISIIYEWEIPYPKKKKGRPLPCPSFYKVNKQAPQ